MNRVNYAISIFLCAISFFSVALNAEFSYDSHGKRDPFNAGSKSKPTQTAEKKVVTNLKLEGVVVDPAGKSVAIVNGEMVSEGDKLGDSIMVKKISKQGVQFEQEGQSIFIPIIVKE